MPASDGLEDYTLGKDYGEHKAGTVIRVDPIRRSWLDENGFSTSKPVPTPKPNSILIDSLAPTLPRRRRGEGL